MLIYPHIDPVAFEIGPLKIYWYGLSYVLSICLCWWHGKRIASHFKIKQKQIDDFISYAILGIIIGGRVGYIIFYDFSVIWEDPLAILKIWEGGMSFHGGFIGFTISCYYYCHKHKIHFWSFTDLIALIAPTGLFLGRLANFINGEHYGRPTTSPLGMIFHHVDDRPRHPSQLYEAVLEGVVLWCLLNCIFYFSKHTKKDGFYSFLFLAGYGCTRFIAEYFRTPDAFYTMAGISITLGQLLSLPMFIIGLYGMFTAYEKRGPFPHTP